MDHSASNQLLSLSPPLVPSSRQGLSRGVTRCLFACCGDGLYRLDAKTGSCVGEKIADLGRCDCAVQLTSDTIAVGVSEDVHILNVETGEVTRQFPDAHFSNISSVEFSPLTRRLVTGGRDGRIVVWDVDEIEDDNVEKCRLEDPSKFVVNLDSDEPFRPNIVVSCSGDESVSFWDIQRALLLQRSTDVHSEDVNALCHDSDKQIQFSGSLDRTVACWDYRTNRTIATSSPLQFARPVNTIMFRQNKSQLIVGSTTEDDDDDESDDDDEEESPSNSRRCGVDDRELCYIYVVDTRMMQKGGGGGGDTTNVIPNVNVVKMWESGHEDEVSGLCGVEDLDLFVTVGVDDQCIKAWREDGSCVWEWAVPSYPSSVVRFVQEDEEGDCVSVSVSGGCPTVAAAALPEMEIMDEATTSSQSSTEKANDDGILPHHHLPSPYSPPSTPPTTDLLPTTYSPSVPTTTHSLYVCTDNGLSQLDAKSGECIAEEFPEIPSTASTTAAVQLSMDEIAVATGRVVNLVNVDFGGVMRELSGGHTVQVYALAAFPRSELLVSGGSVRKMVVWNLGEMQKDKELMFRFEDHVGDVYVLDCDDLVRPNVVVSGSDDQTVGFWDIRQGKVLRRCSGEHSGAVFGLCHDSEKQVQFSGSDDRTVVCWDYRTNQKVLALPTFPTKVQTVTFRKQKSQLVVGCSEDASIHVIDTRMLQKAEEDPTRLRHFPSNEWASGHYDAVLNSCDVEDLDLFVTIGSEDRLVKAWRDDQSCVWEWRAPRDPFCIFAFFAGRSVSGAVCEGPADAGNF